MTINTSTTAGRIISGIVVAVVLFLCAAIISDSNRVSVLEVKVQAVERAIEESKAQMETNRKENNEAHDKMQTMLQELLRRK